MMPTLAPSHHPNHPPRLTDIRMRSFRIGPSSKLELSAVSAAFPTATRRGYWHLVRTIHERSAFVNNVSHRYGGTQGSYRSNSLCQIARCTQPRSLQLGGLLTFGLASWNGTSNIQVRSHP